jgi:hypothetical protein
MAESNWQPIKTAPKDGTEFLAYSKRCGKCDVVEWMPSVRDFLPVQMDGEMGPLPYEFGYKRHDATHWMPLPTPPQAEGGE